MAAIGLELNEEKTQLVRLPERTFDFLGYTFGRFCTVKSRRWYWGTRPSKKALRRVCKRIHDETSQRWNPTTAEDRVGVLNPILRGWCQYFNQGPVFREYDILKRYAARRFRRWLMKKHGRRGTGYRQYSDEYLYEKLGLYKPNVSLSRPAVSEGTTS
jgi:hypothetical protein